MDDIAVRIILSAQIQEQKERFAVLSAPEREKLAALKNRVENVGV